MTVDAILDIKKAEEEAEQIVRRSADDSRTILADAKSQAEKIVKGARLDGNMTAEEKIALSERRAAAEIEKIKRKTALDCELIAKNARAKFEEAAAIIAGRIVKLNVDR